ncbi:MAG: DPP IV N-terminal domain-containing protein [Chloroflexota bacterium]
MSTGPTNSPSKDSPPGEPDVKQLLREGRAAIKMGDKVSARTKLKQVVALDQYSEQGWFLLASVVETDDERRVCLGNVVVINPKNERAQQMLDQLSGNLNAGLISGEPQLDGRSLKISNRRVLIIGGIIGAVVILAALVFVVLPTMNTPPPPTSAVEAVTAAALIAQHTTETAAVVSQGPTQTPTTSSVRPTLPPTWTPSASPPPVGQIGTPLPVPPEGLTGRLTAISGILFGPNRDLPIYILDPYGKDMRPISGKDVGDQAILTPDGSRVIFSRYIASTNSRTLRLVNANGTRGSEVNQLWGNTPPLAEVKDPTISRNGAVLVFSAINITGNESTANLYLVSLKGLNSLNSDDNGSEATEPATLDAAPADKPTSKAATVAPPTPTAGDLASQLKRVTLKDTGSNSEPSISPDGKEIVYVNDSRPVGEDSIDLFAISPNGGKPRRITDDQRENIESAPEFSPDGKQIAYQSMQKDSKTNDIYIMNTDGSGKVQLTTSADDNSDNIRPHWSPDGKFIAFSSTRNGKWEIYIIQVDTKAVFQVTQTTSSTICTGWGSN